MVTLKQILESLLFASARPLPTKTLLAALRSAADFAQDRPEPAEYAKTKEVELVETLTAMQEEYSQQERGFDLCENAGGWVLVSKAQCSPWVRHLFPEMKPARLSPPSLETLAIIAYRQPVTRADIEAVRGVAVDGVVQTLLDRGLIKIAGRAEVPGRPLLYETTQYFMEHFGLRNLDELPNADELRKIQLPTAPVEDVPPPEASSHASPPSAEGPAESAIESEGVSDQSVPVEASSEPAETVPANPEAQ